jgi:iron complex outermembrane receptor protein
MKKINLLARFSFIALLFVFGAPLLAGENVEIKIIDTETGEPISGLVFEYGNEGGRSDADGIIRITLEKDEVLKLRHVGYGVRILQDYAVREAAHSGILKLDGLPVNFFPVTVIALRPKSDEGESLNLDFEDKMAHDGGAILLETPGISSIRKSGGYGFDPVMRGFKYDQLNIVVNGAQSAVAACPNRMDPPTSQMTPNMAERIEILKGPHALRYGNAFGGTINFISPEPNFSTDFDTYGRLSGGFESNGEIMRSEGMFGISGEKYDIGLFAAWTDGSNYESGDGTEIPAQVSRGSFGLNASLKPFDNNEISISATRNIARDVDFPSLPMDLRDDDTWLVNARHNINFDNGKLQSWTTTAYASFVDHKMDNFSKNLEPRMVNAATDATTYNYGGRTEGIFKFGKNELFAGADLRIDGAEGTRSRDMLMGPMAGKTMLDNVWQDAQIAKAALFGEYHINRNSWKMAFSGRLESNISDAANVDAGFSGLYPEVSENQFNFSLSAGGIYNFENDMALGFWAGRAMRSGGLTERFINFFPVGLDPYEIVGNPNLAPEINNQADITFSWRKSSFIVNLDIFGSYLQDYISPVIDSELSPKMQSSPGVRRFTNIGSAAKAGFEFSCSRRLFAGLAHNISAAYTYGQNLETDEPLPEIAPLDFRYRLTGSYLKGKLHPEIGIRHVIEQERISDEFGEKATPSFTLVDAKISWQVLDYLGFTGGVRNLFDEQYYEHLSRAFSSDRTTPIYSPGRNFYLSVSLNFE